MGTSRGYEMPRGGKWKKLKNDATDLVQGTGGVELTVGSLLADFLRVVGGTKGVERGNGGSAPAVDITSAKEASSPRAKKAPSPINATKRKLATTAGAAAGGGGGSAVIGTARNLGGFLSRIGDVGTQEALRERGLQRIVGQSAAEVAGVLLDEFAGPASTLDNALAREALADVRDEILGDAETFEEVEQRLNLAVDERGVFAILASFFGHYIFRMFCRNFYEDWVKKAGESKAATTLRQIKEYITSSLRAKLTNRKIVSDDWKKTDGTKISGEVLKETMEVFGVLA